MCCRHRATGRPARTRAAAQCSSCARHDRTRVRGFGAHPNLFDEDWTTEHIKIEIFAGTETVDALVNTITDVARNEAGSDGVVGVIRVDRLLRVADAPYLERVLVSCPPTPGEDGRGSALRVVSASTPKSRVRTTGWLLSRSR